MSDSTVPAAVLETLERLSSKSGVIAAYAMEATSSTILATTGSLNFGTAHTASTTTTASPDALNSAGSYDTPLHASSTSTGANGPSEQPFDFATRIWQFVKFSRGLVQDLDGEDELRLLRLRTKRYEFMIVPDPKYIFVVVHEVPA